MARVAAPRTPSPARVSTARRRSGATPRRIVWLSSVYSPRIRHAWLTSAKRGREDVEAEQVCAHTRIASVEYHQRAEVRRGVGATLALPRCVRCERILRRGFAVYDVAPGPRPRDRVRLAPKGKVRQ